MTVKRQVEKIRKRVGSTQQLTPQESAFMQESYHCPDKISNGGTIVTINASDQDKETAQAIIRKLCPGADIETRHINIKLERHDSTENNS